METENIIQDPLFTLESVDAIHESTSDTPTSETETPTTDTGTPTVLLVDGGQDTVTTVRSASLNPYEAGDGLAGVVNTIFGEYQPRTQTVTVTSSDGSSDTFVEAVGGLAGLDYYWLSGVLFFTVVFVSFFKLLGVVFKR